MNVKGQSMMSISYGKSCKSLDSQSVYIKIREDQRIGFKLTNLQFLEVQGRLDID